MNSSDKFAQYRPQGSVTTNETPSMSSTDSSADKFAKYRPKADSATDVAKRYATQSITRPLEAIGSIPGNLLRFLSDYGTKMKERERGVRS